MWEEASCFITQFHHETNQTAAALSDRLEAVRHEIAATGTYFHTYPELQFGARVAWRNNTRCIGRLYWKTLKVNDLRHLNTPEEISTALTEHLHFATNGGDIRSVISIFRQQMPDEETGPFIENNQLIRYAGYPLPDGTVLGDPAQLEFTRTCQAMGWNPAQKTAFDILPWVIRWPGHEPLLCEVPTDAILEVPLEHPEFGWWPEMGLKWHAVPVISDMVLDIGGIRYTAAPFNGWYMSTEIGSRNLADQKRYNMLPEIALRMGLSQQNSYSLWKDRALVELNTSVLYSFQKAGVRITGHHDASAQFIHFEYAEQKHGRPINADWSWIVPPMSASTMEVFHKTYQNGEERPNFFYRQAAATAPASACPFLSGTVLS